MCFALLRHTEAGTLQQLWSFLGYGTDGNRMDFNLENMAAEAIAWFLPCSLEILRRGRTLSSKRHIVFCRVTLIPTHRGESLRM